jgi:hypothetical protein
MDWMLKEFQALPGIISGASDLFHWAFFCGKPTQTSF